MVARSVMSANRYSTPGTTRFLVGARLAMLVTSEIPNRLSSRSKAVPTQPDPPVTTTRSQVARAS